MESSYNSSSELGLQGAELIRNERDRQIMVEGFGPDHDAHYPMGELSCAAGAYVMAAAWQVACPGESLPGDTPPMWPDLITANLWWKPSNDPVRNLVKAGALIAAEIDRIQHQKVILARIEHARNSSQQ